MPGRLSNNVTVEPFSRENVDRLARQAVDGEDGGPGDQVGYVARYLETQGAKTIVVERHYIDRHFREEFDLYYSRLLRPPPTHCHRLHFFRRDFVRADLIQLLDRALSEREQVEEELSGEYLGYVVLRPVPHALVGRSILRLYDDKPEREILATSRLTAHLMGLELSVQGTAFQQQDRAVGACATAAVWMALSRVARLEGTRSPSPAFIARAAARMAGAEGRFLPSRGLTILQVTDAIRECGYEPEAFRSTPNPAEFLFQLHCYLRSGLPAVLIVADDGADDAHAVTAVGYRIGSVRPELETMIPTRSRRIDRLYLHDDRLGPYARAHLTVDQLPADPALESKSPTPAVLSVTIHLDDREDEEQEPPLRVRHAIVPVSPRLRLPPQDLLAIGSQYADLLEAAGAQHGAESEVFFVRAGKYLEDVCRLQTVTDLRFATGALGAFMSEIALPRWVCVNRWWSADGVPLADFLLDTTDILRGDDVGRTLLAIAGFDPKLGKVLGRAAADWHIPSLV